MKINIDHQTASATKPLAHAVWDEPHDVSVPDYSLGTLGATVTIDLANGTFQAGTMSANLTITLPPIPSGIVEHVKLLLSGNYAIVVQTHAVLDSGTTPDAGTSTVLFDTSKSWTTNEFVGDYLHITSGANAGLYREISSNSSNMIEVGEAFPSVIASGITYQVLSAPPTPFVWLHNEAPEFGTVRNLMVFSGTSVAGWVGDGGKA